MPEHQQRARRSTGSARWIAVGALTTVLTGCAVAADDPEPSSNPSDAAPGFAASSTVDALVEARPADEDVIRTRRVETAPDGAPATVLDIDEDGALLATVSADADGAELGTPRLGTLDADGFTPLPYDASDSSGTQITAAEARGDRIAWVETSSTDLFRFDWDVWLLDGDDRVLVDSSERIGPDEEQPRVFGETVPVLSDTAVHWAAADGETAVLLSGDGRGESRETAAGLGLPVVVGETLYAVRSPELDPAQRRTTIVAHDLATGEETTVVAADLGDDAAVTKLAARGGRLAWVVSRPEAGSSTLHVRELSSGRTQAIRMRHPGLSTMSLALTEHLLAWGNGSAEGDSGVYVMDLSDDSLWRLHDEPGYSVVHAEDTTLAWGDLEDGEPTADVQVGRWER